MSGVQIGLYQASEEGLGEGFMAWVFECGHGLSLTSRVAFHSYSRFSERLCWPGHGHDLTKITSVICPSAANCNSIKAIGLLVSVSKTEWSRSVLQYGTRIRDWVPLSDSSYLEVSRGDGVGNKPKRPDGRGPQPKDVTSGLRVQPLSQAAALQYGGLH